MTGSLNAISNYCIINCTTYVFNKLYLQTMNYVFVAEEDHPSQELFHDQHEIAGEAEVTEFIPNSPGNKI